MPYHVVEFGMQRHGIIEPSPHLLVVWGSLSDPAAIVDQLRPRFAGMFAGGTMARLGVGQAVRTANGKLVTAYKLCIDTAGAVAVVEMLKPSGFPMYDAKLQREMRLWRYTPFTVDGVAKPVCTSVTFIYQQRN